MVVGAHREGKGNYLRLTVGVGVGHQNSSIQNLAKTIEERREEKREVQTKWSLSSQFSV